MATTLLIMYGTTSIDLTSGNFTLQEFVPSSGGGSHTDRDYIRVLLEGDTASDIETEIANIEKVFRQAEFRYKTKRGDKAYIKCQLDGAPSLYYSEIEQPDTSKPAGTIIYPSNMGLSWTRKQILLEIQITRKNYWENNSETELSLANAGDSGTGGIEIMNAHDKNSPVFTGSTVSFTAYDTIADSGNGFGIFRVGDVISVRGSTSNDGVYTVAEVDAGGADITVNEEVSNESAGDSISIFNYLNYVDIDGDDIAGNLPAPIRVEITNTYATYDLETVWMSIGYLNSPLAFAHVLEIGDSDTGSDVGDTSLGSNIQRTYAISDTEAKVTGWTIKSDMVNSADSGFFRVMAYFATSTNVTQVRWRIKILGDGSVIWSGDSVLFSDTYAAVARVIRPLETVQIPPYKLAGNESDDITLELWAVRTADAINVVIDNLQLFPTDGDNFRMLRSRKTIPQNSVLIDDGVRGSYYQENASGEKTSDILVKGKPLEVFPGKDCRIYFLLHSDTDNEGDIDITADVRVYYRSRKMAL